MKNLLIKPAFILFIICGGIFNYTSAQSVREITFENKTDSVVDDLHIEFTHKETEWDRTATHTFPSERHSGNRHNQWGTTIAPGGTATATFTYSGAGDLTINRWWWTRGGNAVQDGKRMGEIKTDNGGSVLAWSGGAAAGNGIIMVSCAGTTGHFQTQPGMPPSQSANLFLAFINNMFNNSAPRKIYFYPYNPSMIYFAGNYLGDSQRELSIQIIQQDQNQPLAKINSIFPMLNLTALIEGLYNPVIPKMVEDYLTIYVRSAFPPFNIIEFNGGSLDQDGKGNYYFFNISNGVPYFIQLQHRNSIETWSRNPVMFNSNQLSYDFTTSSAKAFGNNLVLKGSRWCDYSGDADQNRMVDLNDILMVYNDASTFTAGYFDTDMDGNNLVDLNDLLITFNNAGKFVRSIRP